MTAVSLDRDPPAWATALARHRDGLRTVALELLDRDRGAWPERMLGALFAAIPTDERKTLLDALCWANDNDGLCAFDAALDALVFAYETHVAAAYQHGPHLGRWQDATREPTVEERADELADLLGLAPDPEADALLADLAAIPVTVVEVQR